MTDLDESSFGRGLGAPRKIYRSERETWTSTARDQVTSGEAPGWLHGIVLHALWLLFGAVYFLILALIFVAPWMERRVDTLGLIVMGLGVLLLVVGILRGPQAPVDGPAWFQRILSGTDHVIVIGVGLIFATFAVFDTAQYTFARGSYGEFLLFVAVIGLPVVYGFLCPRRPVPPVVLVALWVIFVGVGTGLAFIFPDLRLL